ncbi:hypothetical protein E2562_036393 [Oryza meyeriana var. granulata]|uniref:DUF834 domain-containing protein n=1 Tax=Oryza meyeriana var. granulata TaxID=110450 RepID=A0A6G1CW72_9ORYZ|nr:hypothetical protein E2562_036393 [Oryza meyeriana var. granulata]
MEPAACSQRRRHRERDARGWRGQRRCDGEDQCEAEVDTGSAVTARGLEREVVADSRNAQWSGVQGTTEGDAMNVVPMEAVAVRWRVRSERNGATEEPLEHGGRNRGGAGGTAEPPPVARGWSGWKRRMRGWRRWMEGAEAFGWRGARCGSGWRGAPGVGKR